MTKISAGLTDDDTAIFNAAVELTRVQLQQAVSIVCAVTNRDAGEVDSGLVGAVVQALATNYAALTRRGDFSAQVV
jgi:hypothetical protein